MLSVRADKPVDADIVDVLRAVDRVASGLNVSYFLVGATARDVLHVHVFGLRPGRATRDVDFALAMREWTTFEKIKAQLQATGQFVVDEKYAHRLRFRRPGSHHDVVVDLIPFGDVAESMSMIKWPPDLMIMMTITGFEDAFRAATPIEIEKGLVVNVARFPGLALLKIYAWKDRRVEDAKDALDFVMLLRSYEQLGNQERIYGEAVHILEQVGYDPELAGAWLLGRDAAAIAAPSTHSELMAMLEDDAVADLMITDMAKALRGRDDSITYATILFTQFKSGFCSLE